MTVENGDIVRASVRFKDNYVGDVMNVWYWQNFGAGPQDDDDVMDALDTEIEAIYTAIRSQLASSQAPYDIKYDVVDNVAGKETVTHVLGTRTFTMSLPPNGSGDKLPGMDSMIVNFRTGIPKVFGRKFFGTVPESANEDGRVISAGVTALTAAAAEVLTAVSIGIGELRAGVFSLVAGALNEWFAEFTAGIVNDILGTRRSRRMNTGS